MIYIMGAEYLGLSGLFTSILQVLNLAELGFSQTIIYSMYKPLAEHDDDKVCALLSVYRRTYHYIGSVILVAGLVCVPLLPRLIHGDYPDDFNIYIIFLVYLFNIFISYWLFAHFNALVFALQRNDIVSRVDILTKVFLNVSQLLVLLTLQNYYIYVIVIPIATILGNVVTFIIVRKKYPRYTCYGDISDGEKTEIRKNVIGMSVTRVAQVTRNSFDNIFVATFLGLTVTAIYNNYFYVMHAINVLMAIISSSIAAGVGDSIATESPEKNYDDLKRFDFLYMMVSGWIVVCMLCLYQPFMILWVGEEYMLGYPAAILFCLYSYFLKMGDIRSVYFEGAGLYWRRRYVSIIEMALNISLNYLLGKRFGVVGIISATLISLFIAGFIMAAQIPFKYYFKRDAKEYFVYHGKYFIVTAAVACATFAAAFFVRIDGVAGMALKLLICVLLPPLFYIVIYYRSKQYGEAVSWFLGAMNLKEKFGFLVPARYRNSE